jgi:hypothetical protein
MSDLLSVIVRRWKSEFKGISALEIRRLLGLSHEAAISELRALEAKGLVRLRDCQLGEPFTVTELPSGLARVRVAPDWKMVDTVMAFPAKHVLEEAFYADRVDYGEFTNRLHRGASQVQHYFFRRDVLDWYLKQRDKYDVHQDATGGTVSMTTAYYLSFPEGEPDRSTFATVRYGVMKLADGSEALGVIAKDLDELPKADQHRWAAHEVQAPVPDERDSTWRQHFAEQFEASWDADHTDHIQDLGETLLAINGLIGSTLFRKTSHPGLHLPSLNTYGEYAAAHKELYKLIGPDNVAVGALKGLLREAGCQDDAFVHPSGKSKGAWALLELLASRRELDWAPFATVAENRHVDSHKVVDAAPSTDYYPRKFRRDLASVVAELSKLKDKPGECS